MSLVLFVCAENRTRSVICEYRLRQLLIEKGGQLVKEIEVASAGCGWTPEDIEMHENKGEVQYKPLFGLPPHTYTIESMRRRGIDISHYRSKELNEATVRESKLIIVFEDAHKVITLSHYPMAERKVFTLQELVGYDGYLINPGYPPDGGWIFDPETNSWGFSDWYLEACITEIEHMLWWGLDKIIDLLKKQ
jgi:protein-tyrosine-phosphatase